MKNFDEIYEEIYSKNNEESEEIKQWNKKVDKKRMKATIISVILILIMLIMFCIIKKSNNELVDGEDISDKIKTTVELEVIGILGLIPVIIVYCSVHKKAYKSFFKEKVLKELVENMDNNLEYDLNTGKDPVDLYNQYNRSGFERYDKYDAEDYIEGKLDGKYPIRMAEIHTQIEHKDSDGHVTRTTVFHGIFCNVECAKNIGASLKIHADKGKLENLFKGKTKIEMDSSEFEKYFDVYGDNKIIAMQILTSEVMEMIIKFIEESKIDYEITIRNNQINIRFHTGEVFETQAPKKLLDYETLETYYDIIDFVFKVSRAINKAIENTEI